MNKFMLGIGGFVLALLALGFALPRESRFVISTDIDAADAAVYLQLIDPTRARLWLLDIGNDAEYSFAGPDRGVGASVTWNSAASGGGTIRVVEASPYSQMTARMNEGEPGEARLVFTLSKQYAMTNLRTEFVHDYGLNIVGRYFGLLATGVLRREFEQSLARLKDIAEGLPVADFGDLEISDVNVTAVPVAILSVTSSPDSASVAEMLDAAYFEILKYIETNALTPAGPPLLIPGDYIGNKRRFDAGIPVSGGDENIPPDRSRVRITRSYSGPAVLVRHIGPYDRLSATHHKAIAYLAAAGIERSGASWESFVSDPAKVDESELVTEIYYPVRAR